MQNKRNTKDQIEYREYGRGDNERILQLESYHTF